MLFLHLLSQCGFSKDECVDMFLGQFCVSIFRELNNVRVHSWLPSAKCLAHLLCHVSCADTVIKQNTHEFRPEEEPNIIGPTCMWVSRLFSVFMQSLYVRMRLRGDWVCHVWRVRYASVTVEIHFTLSGSVRELKTFRQHFCRSEQIPDLRTICLTDSDYTGVTGTWRRDGVRRREGHTVKPRTHCSCSSLVIV